MYPTLMVCFFSVRFSWVPVWLDNEDGFGSLLCFGPEVFRGHVPDQSCGGEITLDCLLNNCRMETSATGIRLRLPSTTITISSLSIDCSTLPGSKSEGAFFDFRSGCLIAPV